MFSSAPLIPYTVQVTSVSNAENNDRFITIVIFLLAKQNPKHQTLGEEHYH